MCVLPIAIEILRISAPKTAFYERKSHIFVSCQTLRYFLCMPNKNNILELPRSIILNPCCPYFGGKYFAKKTRKCHKYFSFLAPKNLQFQHENYVRQEMLNFQWVLFREFIPPALFRTFWRFFSMQ